MKLLRIETTSRPSVLLTTKVPTGQDLPTTRTSNTISNCWLKVSQPSLEDHRDNWDQEEWTQVPLEVNVKATKTKEVLVEDKDSKRVMVVTRECKEWTKEQVEWTWVWWVKTCNKCNSTCRCKIQEWCSSNNTSSNHSSNNKPCPLTSTSWLNATRFFQLWCLTIQTTRIRLVLFSSSLSRESLAQKRLQRLLVCWLTFSWTISNPWWLTMTFSKLVSVKLTKSFPDQDSSETSFTEKQHKNFFEIFILHGGASSGFQSLDKHPQLMTLWSNIICCVTKTPFFFCSNFQILQSIWYKNLSLRAN